MTSRGYAAIGLHMSKNSINIGSALRNAHCFGASMVAVSGRRYQRACTDTSAAYRHLPLVQCENLYDVVPFDCVPVAVELTDNARDIRDYIHPERAMYIFGPEEGSLPKSVTSWCRDVIKIPMSANCLNLAVTTGLVLYDRLQKQK